MPLDILPLESTHFSTQIHKRNNEIQAPTWETGLGQKNTLEEVIF